MFPQRSSACGHYCQKNPIFDRQRGPAIIAMRRRSMRLLLDVTMPQEVYWALEPMHDLTVHLQPEDATEGMEVVIVPPSGAVGNGGFGTAAAVGKL